MVYVFLVLVIANSALGEDLLKKLRDFLKWLVSWFLKTILYVFTGYIAVTGVVSGTTDQAALKATKLTISGVVPVVGGILSDASEAVLVSAGLVKSAVGVYGMIAIAAIAITPFLQIAVQYLLLKLTAAVCGIFGNKRSSELIGDFSAAMGLLLAMTGTVCLLLLISTVCFMKGMG
jgi:stage III sporulation protein AE